MLRKLECRLAFLLVAALVGCRAERPPTAPSRAAADFRDVPIGLCEDHPPESTSDERMREDFAALARAGVRLLRVSFGWDDLEPERDRYDFAPVDQVLRHASEAGVRLIPYVCYTPAWLAPPNTADNEVYRSPPTDNAEFEQLMEQLAARYRGRFLSWELWNEPDNREYWLGTAKEYAALLAAGSRGVKRGDPEARVVLGGIAGHLEFLEELLRDHGAARAIDVVNLHSYSETWNAEPLESIPDYLARAAELVKRYGEREPLWLAEVGYSSFRRGDYVSDWYKAKHPFEHTAEFQASAMVRVLSLARGAPELELIAWYELRDLPPGTEVIGDQNNRHLGVLDPGGSPKPAFHALTRVLPLLSGPLRSIDVQARAADTAAPLEARAFQRADGRCVIVSWLPTTRVESDATRVRVSFALPARSSATVASLADALTRDQSLPLRSSSPVVTSELELSPERTAWIVVDGCSALP